MIDEYDYSLYFHVVEIILPSLLKEAHEKGIKFVVKGSKAIQKYIIKDARGDFIPAPDWDVIVHNDDLFDFITYKLKKIFKNSDLSIVSALFGEIPLKQIGFNKNLLFIDIVKDTTYNIENYKIIKGIPYLNCRDLKEDLKQNAKDRRKKLDELDDDPFGSEESFVKGYMANDQEKEEQVNIKIEKISNFLKKRDVDEEDIEKIKIAIEDIIELSLKRRYDFETCKDFITQLNKNNTLRKKYNLTILRNDLLVCNNKRRKSPRVPTSGSTLTSTRKTPRVPTSGSPRTSTRKTPRVPTSGSPRTSTRKTSPKNTQKRKSVNTKRTGFTPPSKKPRLSDGKKRSRRKNK